ncbi:MAG: ammonia-forming cytochrome c nitrite reductase [Ferrimonas sp.]
MRNLPSTSTLLLLSTLSSAFLPVIAAQSPSAPQITVADNAAYQRFQQPYQSWLKTSESIEIIDVLEENPVIVVLWAGSGYAKEDNQPRGHYYSITDIRANLRTGAPMTPTEGPMPMACWSCKSPDVPRVIETSSEAQFFKGKWARGGSEITNMIGCGNCHDNNLRLRIALPFANRAMESIGWTWQQAEHWQQKTMVCSQCHVEYYLTQPDNFVKFPWGQGTTAEQIGAYYDSINFTDWIHPISKAPMLKAQHPGFELSRTSTHGRNKVACTDCHMPVVTNAEGRRFTDHNVGNPFERYEFSCGRCHSQTQEQMQVQVDNFKQMISSARQAAEQQLLKAHFEAQAAWEAGATPAEMASALQAIRHGQFRWDMATASHGVHIHNPTEALRLLASATNEAANARADLLHLLASYGVSQPVAIPDISTKAAAQAAMHINVEEMERKKMTFLQEIVPKWQAEYNKKYGASPLLP